MKVFITGGSGYIGSAVVERFLQAGHEVTALARPQSDTRRLRERGAAILSGELSSLSEQADVLRQHDVFVHTAVSQDANKAADDSAAIEAFLRFGSGQFIYTSGVWVLGDTGDGVADESSQVNPLTLAAWRAPHEQSVLMADRESLSTSVLRPGCVYGGRQSMLGEWFAAVLQHQPMRMVGSGTNRWSLVDLFDLAECYLAIVEQRSSGLFHATDDSEDTLNEIALTISRSAGIDTPIEHTPADQARSRLGAYADALAVNQRVSSRQTRRALGWTPRRTFQGSIQDQWREWSSIHGPGVPAQG